MSGNVISHNELERLASLRSDHGIVSAYVKVNPSLMRDRTHPLTGFKGSYKRFARRTRSERWLAVAARERTTIIRFLENWQPRGRGLAIFACEPAGLWEVVSLNVPVASLLHVDVTTHTGVLTQILDEYPRFVGWGHSSISHALRFAELAGVNTLVPFHHEPSHSDQLLDELFERALASKRLPFELAPAMEGASFEI